MKRYNPILLILVLLITLVTAYGSAPPSAPLPVKQVLIGFTASDTGRLNVESKKQIQGLQIWLDQVNKAGGIKLKNGTLLMPAIKSYEAVKKYPSVGFVLL